MGPGGSLSGGGGGPSVNVCPNTIRLGQHLKRELRADPDASPYDWVAPAVERIQPCDAWGRSLTIYEQLLATLTDRIGTLLTAADIRRRVVEAFGTNPTSVIPSDYCYNRLNLGVPDPKPLFLRVGAGEYQFVGPTHPYTGLVYGRPRGTTTDRIVGERVEGVLRLYDQGLTETPPVTGPPDEARTSALPLSSAQLDHLYAEYMEVLMLETTAFGCQPTETRHLIGRLGELYCARLTRGQLARRVNQAGFDVVAESGRRISVKTTAQERQQGFVTINRRTADLADDLMVLRYADGAFEILYHGEIARATSAARVYDDRFELDLRKAAHLA